VTTLTKFELFIAKRYLRARRKEAVISIITLISVIGVAAGVMALVIALAVTSGLRDTLQRNLLGAMAHINVLERNPSYGIENWREMAERLKKVPHVTAVAPALYGEVMLSAVRQKGVLLKGVDIDAELSITEALRHLKAGSTDGLRQTGERVPCLILGVNVVQDSGMTLNSRVDVLTSQGELTPYGVRPSIKHFRVCGIFQSGFYDIDDNWAYAALTNVQRTLSLDDVVNQLELKVDDLDRAGDIAKEIEKVVGPKYTTTTWMERNRPLFSALRTERIVTIIVIGLIELIAALNIFITLVMMVMEKYRDIAVLMSMGSRREQIRRIFMLQGVLIGIVGSIGGLIVGYTLCYFADKYHWIPLDEQVYSIPYVPFQTNPLDGIWIAGAAILVSFLATIYPARNATRISPAEVLRYE
jgi:lipoprotein-releasing system permease protein